MNEKVLGKERVCSGFFSTCVNDKAEILSVWKLSVVISIISGLPNSILLNRHPSVCGIIPFPFHIEI